MPYRKRYKRGGSKLSKKQRKQVKQLINEEVEDKFHLTGGFGGIDDAGSIVDISKVPQGVLEGERVADQITLRGLNYRFIWTNESALSIDSYNVVRTIIFRWYGEGTLVGGTGAVTYPTVSAVLEPIAGGPYINAHYNDLSISKGLLKIIYDSSDTLNTNVDGGGTYYTAGARVHSKRFKASKLGKKHVDFDENLLQGTNHVYVLWVSDSAALSVFHPSVKWQTQLIYQDA